MTPEAAQAFWTLHTSLPREGPGEAADVAWAAGVARIPVDARICDAGCGPGADLEALLEAAPRGHVTAIEKHPDFVEAAAARNLDRVDVQQGDIAELSGPYDFIWCAGAMYFLGITEGLTLWRTALARGGTVAFTEPCWLTANPPEEARANWAEYSAMTDAAGIADRVAAARYETLATRLLSDTAWEAYYGPMQQRIDALQADAGAHLAVALREAQAEIDAWRNHRKTFGYLLSVVRPA